MMLSVKSKKNLRAEWMSLLFKAVRKGTIKDVDARGLAASLEHRTSSHYHKSADRDLQAQNPALFTVYIVLLFTIYRGGFSSGGTGGGLLEGQWLYHPPSSCPHVEVSLGVKH